MATLAKIEANNKKLALATKYMEKRVELRNKSKDMTVSQEERDDARKALGKLPKDSNLIRYRKRCQITGRPRGNIGRFGLSRMKFREMALLGLLPGVTKSSW